MLEAEEPSGAVGGSEEHSSLVEATIPATVPCVFTSHVKEASCTHEVPEEDHM